MIKTIAKFAGGPIALAALLLVGTKGGRKLTKKAIQAIRESGSVAGDKCRGLIEQVQEASGDLIAEAKAELKPKKKRGSHS
jgi:hypothetical protein